MTATAFTIELSPEREAILRRAAARRGMGSVDLLRETLEEQLDVEEQQSRTHAPSNGAELVAYWQAEGVVGAWADRIDIGDSAEYARALRSRAETRAIE